jgi:hypothetical protein
MSDLLKKIQREKVRAAEDAVIAGIPKDLLDKMKEAQREHEAKGGCPGCGCMTFACHRFPCPVADNDLY